MVGRVDRVGKSAFQGRIPELQGERCGLYAWEDIQANIAYPDPESGIGCR